METQKELVDWIYDLHLQNNTEHDTFEEAFKAGIECAIEELSELKKLRVTDVSVCACGSTKYYIEQYKDVTKYYCSKCHEKIESKHCL